MNKQRIYLVAPLVILISGISFSADPTPTPTPKDPSRTNAGIRTDFGDVLVENLGIGRSYNLREIAGVPFKVTNTGAETVNLICDPQIPAESMISKTRKELGEVPVPSVDWVKLTQSQFVVPPGESAFADVIITIPNDPSLYGKKYQASIYSRTSGKNFLQLGVFSHIHMTIIQSPEVQAEMEKNKKQHALGNVEYTLLPDKILLENAPLGQKIDVKKAAKKTIMIANSGETPAELRVRVVSIGDTPLSLQQDYIEPKNRDWLKVKQDVVKVDPASFEDPGLTLELPKDPELKGKKLMFVLKVSPANPDVVGATFYGKIYVEVEK